MARLWLLSFLFVTFSTFGWSAQFKNDQFHFDAKVNESFSVSLTDLLSDLGQTPRQWSANSAIPNWLTLDSTNERLYGSPGAADVSTSQFLLSVQQGEQGAITQIEIKVLALPKWSTQNLDLGLQQEDTAFTFDLNAYVTDPAEGALNFRAENLPSWMSLTPQGLLTGTPRRPNVGAYKNLKLTADGKGGSTSISAYGEVLKTIKPPKWVSNPITLPNTLEDATFKKNLSEFVVHTEPTKLSFSLASSSKWLQITESGSLFGIPGKAQVGNVSVMVRAQTVVDGKTFEAITEVTFRVIHVNHPPQWKEDPILLPTALTDVSYSQNLALSAMDPDDGDNLSFQLIEGPSWARLDKNGNFSGNPTKADIGENRWRVQVSDNAGLNSEATLVVAVRKSPEKPYWVQNPIVLKQAQEDFNYTADLNQYAVDPDGDRLSFSDLVGPEWLNLTENGILSGTPFAAHVGLHKLKVRVSDNITGSSTADIFVEVLHTNHAPQWVLNPIFFQVDSESEARLSIAGYAKDVDGDTLQITKVTGPNWATLSASGELVGTPNTPDLGENTFQIRAMDSDGAQALTTVIVTVLPINHAPSFTADPILLADTKEKLNYSANLSAFATDPDPFDRLTFSKVSGPAWIQIGSSGTVTGVPAREHLGLNVAEVRVMDQDQEFAVTHIHINVIKVNQAPRWRKDPIDLGQATEDTLFNFELSKYVADDDGDTLSFTVLEGPSWLTTGNGTVTGTPRRHDVGTFEGTLRVSDGKLHADVSVFGHVTAINHPPVFPTGIVYNIKERESFQTDLRTKIKDADGDELRFTTLAVPDFLSVQADGVLKAMPRFQNIGEHQIKLRVDDGKLFAEGTIQVVVERNPRPPAWLENPIRLEARTNEAFVHDLSRYAKDADGLPLTFNKVSGPGWLNITDKGLASGTPSNGELGENIFEIRVQNDVLGSETQLLVQVVPGTHQDEIVIGEAVIGAPTENIWLIDSSQFSYALVKSLKLESHVYFSALEEAGLKHKATLISTDAARFDGNPVIHEGAAYFGSENQDVNFEFKKRIDLANTYNCYNTPIWSLLRFFDKLPTLKQGSFFEHGVSTNAILLTQQRDHYKKFATGEFGTWTVSDFGQRFLDFAKARQKPFTLSAIAPRCPSLKETSGEEWSAAPQNTYQTLTHQTGGRYYDAQCQYNVREFLKDFAQHVIERAYISAKRNIVLTKHPIETHTMEVRLGDVTLDGNSGSESDLWRYDPSLNRIEIYWDRIPSAQWNPNATLSIRYRVS